MARACRNEQGLRGCLGNITRRPGDSGGGRGPFEWRSGSEGLTGAWNIVVRRRGVMVATAPERVQVIWIGGRKKDAVDRLGEVVRGRRTELGRESDNN